jgi:hypothetical protein
MLSDHISAHISRLRESRVAVISTTAVASAILEAHPHIAGADCDFYRALTFEKLKDEARKLINKMKLKPELEPDRQLLLPGFKRLQQYYVIEEDGEAQRVDLIPGAVLLKKAAELRVMGAGCYQHADEIEDYVGAREAA